MLLSKFLASSLPISLGLVISLISEEQCVEIARGGPMNHTCDGTPDLEVWVGRHETARVVALTEDGEAFLDLMRE